MQKEITLKLNPSPNEPVPSPPSPLPRLLLTIIMLAALAAMLCGRWIRPNFPQPDLIPKEKISITKPKIHEEVVSQKNRIACQLELQAKRFRFRAENPFPACMRAFREISSCNSQKLDFLEAIYLYAYAFSSEKTDSARLLLQRHLPLLQACPDSLPLKQRFLQLQAKLKN